MRIPLFAAALFCACASALATEPLKAPEFHPLRVPAGKSSADLQPSPVRAESPIVLKLKAHRHADGSLVLQCDHHIHASEAAEAEGEALQ